MIQRNKKEEIDSAIENYSYIIPPRVVDLVKIN